jgi:hypothetical protein
MCIDYITKTKLWWKLFKGLQSQYKIIKFFMLMGWDNVSELQPQWAHPPDGARVWTAMVEWHREKQMNSWEKPVPVPLCPPHIPHGLTGREPGPLWWEASLSHGMAYIIKLVIFMSHYRPLYKGRASQHNKMTLTLQNL